MSKFLMTDKTFNHSHVKPHQWVRCIVLVEQLASRVKLSAEDKATLKLVFQTLSNRRILSGVR